MTPTDFEQLVITEVLQNSNHVVTVVDAHTIVRWISSSVYAYNVDEPVGQSMADLIHPEDLDRAAQALVAVSQAPERSPMANTIVPIRIMMRDNTFVPFDASARWVPTDDGDGYLVVIMQDVTTDYAVGMALRALARGAGEAELVQAVLNAAHMYGDVTGAQLEWDAAGTIKTAGGLGEQPGTLGDLTQVSPDGDQIEVPGADWGYAFPIGVPERQGTMVIWGDGPTPMSGWIVAALDPLLEVAGLVIRRSRELRELERRATTDELTGLLNRHALLLELDLVIEGGAVIYVDIDEFKMVNDAQGHTIGDHVLRVVGRRLVETIGLFDDEAVIGRIGGDEFVMVLRNVTEPRAFDAGEKLAAALSDPMLVETLPIVSGASVGIAHSDVPVSGRVLLERADQALLEAKSQGKGRSVVAAPA